MIIHLTPDELMDLRDLHTNYMAAHSGTAFPEEDRILHEEIAMQLTRADRLMLDTWSQEFPIIQIPLILTPVQWRPLQTVLAEHITQQAPHGIFFLNNYPELLQKLASYELAAYVEEALETETTS